MRNERAQLPAPQGTQEGSRAGIRVQAVTTSSGRGFLASPVLQAVPGCQIGLGEVKWQKVLVSTPENHPGAPEVCVAAAFITVAK